MTIRTASIKSAELSAVLASTLAIAAPPTAEAAMANLDVGIEGFRSDDGDVRVMLQRQVTDGDRRLPRRSRCGRRDQAFSVTRI